ncbi:hemolysin regulation protein AhpA, partial [Glaesserella parasuis]|nr:hemolysin regulation protein AhpA [Glaesserella parasuis]
MYISREQLIKSSIIAVIIAICLM